MPELGALPKHIAIIMDGNGRWAERRLRNRTFGHAEGVERAREITRECAKRGVEALTLYTFSTENWSRPETEITFLMRLLLRYLKYETKELVDNNIQFRAVGMVEMLPKGIQKEIHRLREATKNNTGMFLNIALSYGGRQEILRATQKIALRVAEGSLSPEQIGEDAFRSELYTAECPDPDLLIRTGGDLRISNFLLWQLAYAELYFTETCWPDFKVSDLDLALAAFSQRERRFGKVANSDESRT
jgi:undecaprenyl diphosphate synthase